MKVAFLFHDNDYNSGATRSLIDSIDKLIEFDDLEIYAFFMHKEGSAWQYLKNKDIKVQYFPYRWETVPIKESKPKKIIEVPRRIVRRCSDFNCANKIVKYLKAQNIDVLYSNSSVITIGAYVKKKYPEIKHIWHIREFGKLDHNFSYFGGEQYFINLVNNYTDQVIYISNSLMEYYVNKIKVPYNIIYDDISPKYIQHHFESYIAKETLKILVVGSITPGKGQLTVLKAAPYLLSSNVNFNIYFAGRVQNERYYNDLKKYINENCLKNNVVFLGQVNDINAIRKNCLIQIVPSSSEAFGRVTLEGMLSNLLVIGTNSGATPELITDKRTGLLFEKENSVELYEILKSIYEGNIEINDIRKNAFSFAKGFTEGKCAKKMYKIINEMNAKKD